MSAMSQNGKLKIGMVWLNKSKYFNRMAVGQVSSSMAFYLDKLPEVSIPKSLLPIGYDPNEDFDERHQGFAQKSQ